VEEETRKKVKRKSAIGKKELSSTRTMAKREGEKKPTN